MHELLIRNCSRHITLTPADIARIPAFFQYRKVKKKTWLLEEGNVCRADCFVLSGCLRMYETSNDGRENVVQFALSDWWIADLYSLLTHTPSAYNIDALEDAEVLLLDHSMREALFREIPAMNIYWRIIMENAFIATQRRVLLLQQPAEARYLDFLERYPHFEQHIPQHQIASYLGITRESLSRIRHAVFRRRSV
ncbi:Crp/Fnr family transcriptional regulator [Chitinophaga vietnamensis]|uniref:Crp/Fnr family transcriptional regulator n=1 Tax=Chitinophaga vietnamensis TaxID=2593957 RepID=UPI0011787F1E|nr:Crp/Fnr family transcriptional regulator [Chitinophaga vietnamensis]